MNPIRKMNKIGKRSNIWKQLLNPIRKTQQNPIQKTQQNQLRKHKQQQSHKTQFRKRNKITVQYNKDSQRHRRIDFKFESSESSEEAPEFANPNLKTKSSEESPDFESNGSRNLNRQNLLHRCTMKEFQIWREIWGRN